MLAESDGVFFYSRTWDTEQGLFLWVQGQPSLRAELQDSQSYEETLSQLCPQSKEKFWMPK